jgi:hypothetical protein
MFDARHTYWQSFEDCVSPYSPWCISDHKFLWTRQSISFPGCHGRGHENDSRLRPRSSQPCNPWQLGKTRRARRAIQCPHQELVGPGRFRAARENRPAESHRKGPASRRRLENVRFLQWHWNASVCGNTHGFRLRRTNCQGEKVACGLSRLHDTPDFPRLSLSELFVAATRFGFCQQRV